MRCAVAGLAVLALGACSYDFKNPAEDLGTGQALGRVVVDRGTGLQPLDGTLVALENSFSFDQVTRSTGRFTLLSLPIGRHRILFRKGTQWAAERLVDIAPGADGKPEGVNLGDVRLRYTVTVSGTFSVGSAFGALGAPVFDVTDEVSGQPAALASVGGGGGGFQFRYTFRGLAPGAHRFRFAVGGIDGVSGNPVTFGAPPLTLDLPESSEGQQLTMNDVPLAPVGSGVGSFRLRVQGVGPGGPASAAAATVELHDALTFDPLGVNTPVDVLRPDSTGYVQADEPAGLYVVVVVPPQPGAQVFYEAPPPGRLLVRDGTFSELGTIYLVDALTGSSAAQACFSSAECEPPGRCVDLRCEGGATVPAPAPAPFSMPFCFVDLQCSTPGGPCGVDGRGICMNHCPDAVTTNTYCFPDPLTQTCTPDGVTIATGVLGNCLP